MQQSIKSPGSVRRAGLGLGLLLAVVVPDSAAQAQTPNTGDLDIRRSKTTGLASFVTGRNGRPVSVQPGPGRTKVQPRDFLVQYGHLFGVTNAAKQLVWLKADTDSLGHRHTTYDQVHRGIPVFSGVLKVHRNKDGAVIAANGDFYPIKPKLDTKPLIDAARAQEIASSLIPLDTVTVAHSELVIVDPGWYGDPPKGTHLAYYVILTAPRPPIRQAFFVDAHSGAILDQWSMLHQSLSRAVYDANNEWDWPGTLARSEGQGPTSDWAVDAAYDYIGDTYDYYFRAFGRRGIDDEDSVVMAVVHYGVDYCNASWNGQAFTFGEGWVTDDVLAHEYTHGVTQYTAGLIYQNQSGQLNESFSDVFGELVDLFNGDAAFAGPPGGSPSWPTHPTGPGLDAPNDLRSGICSDASDGYADGVRWLVGEDITAPCLGLGGSFRDMWDPTCYGDPDRANSELQVCNPFDRGGVHSGSGVPNHAFAILTDGKTFNGYTVSGIGPIKAGAVWYRALTVYLTVASDFEDAYAALNQAASDLSSGGGVTPNDPRTGTASDSAFTTADAAEVDQALLAVEMNTPGSCGQTVAVLDSDPPPDCTRDTLIFADDFAGGANGWTVSNTGPPTPYNWVQVSDLPFERPGTAWFGEDRNIGDCFAVDESAIHYLYSPVITLPAELNHPLVSFTHYVATEAGWDGGNVKVRLDSGPWQLLPAEAFFHNTYNANPLAENPLNNEPGFSGLGGTWGTSVASVDAFVTGGGTIQFRFDFAKDGCTGYIGWYLDDFELYDCADGQDCNTNGLLDEIELTGGVRPDVVVRNPPTRGAMFISDRLFTVCAENFTIDHAADIESVKVWGSFPPDNNAGSEPFAIRFHKYDQGLPGSEVVYAGSVQPTAVETGNDVLDTFWFEGYYDEWELTFTLPGPVQLEPGSYYVELYRETDGSNNFFAWEASRYIGLPGFAVAEQAPGQQWYRDYFGLTEFDLAIEIIAGSMGTDCEPNGVPDECDVADGTNQDCNTNSTPDECDVATGVSNDVNSNAVPDECEDCNDNDLPDDLDLDDGTSQDCNTNLLPDECDLADGTSPDVNTNGVPDECDECLVTSECDDGLYCSGTETCVDGVCQAGTTPCPGQLCDEQNTTCVQCLSGADCDNGLYCDGGETCDASGSCVGGTAPCTAEQMCDEAGNQCVECLADNDCPDGNNCTADTCVSGVCQHTLKPECTDFDEDGVTDDVDLCLNSPAGADVDEDGCACSQLDDDGDGVHNCTDLCPNTPRSDDVDDAGCTVEPPPAEPPADDGPGDETGDEGGSSDVGDAEVAPPAEAEPPADDEVVTDPPVTDPIPDLEEEPGAEASEDQQDTAGPSGSGRGSASRSSGGTCGLLGMVNLLFLVSGMALLGRWRLR